MRNEHDLVERAMNWVNSLLERPFAYRLWQAAFADRKVRPMLVHIPRRHDARVLDVGCGPGTNSRYFAPKGYVGIDINPRYIADAGRRHGGKFIAADVTTYPFEESGFDAIIVNSLLHHLTDEEVNRLLERVSKLVGRDGRVHILELEVPERRSVASLLVRLDRGKYARSHGAWMAIFEKYFEPKLVQRFVLGVPMLPLWHMIYFNGASRA